MDLISQALAGHPDPIPLANSPQFFSAVGWAEWNEAQHLHWLASVVWLRCPP